MDPTIKTDDTLGLTGELEAIIAARLPLTPLPVTAGIERLEGPFGWEDLHLYTAPKLDRLSVHRFFITGRLREHLCLAWPGDDYDIPALGLDIYEHPDDFTLVADWIPFRDLVDAPDYYKRYMAPFAELVAERWPTLLEHMVQPIEPPKPWFDKQLGSCLALHVNLHNSGIEAACDFQREATRRWCDLWERAEPLCGDERLAYNARRRRLIATFRAHDYNSGATQAMARVVGQEATDALFSAIFGS